MKIIVDAMGGDNAPLAPVQGALEAHKRHGIDILLVGRAADILRCVEECGEKTLPKGVELRDASEVVEICDDPATAFKVKKDSSLTVGLNLLKEAPPSMGFSRQECWSGVPLPSPLQMLLSHKNQ